MAGRYEDNRLRSGWLTDPDFRAALLKAETAAIDDTGRRLIAGQQKALDALDQLIDAADKDGDRRLAATAWLDFTLRLRELKNIETRLESLEEIIFGQLKRKA